MATGGTLPAVARRPDPGWAMIDRYVIVSDLANGTTSTECETSGGTPVRATLDLAPPPRISYVHMHVPGWTTEYKRLYGMPHVVAGDRDLLLLRMGSPTHDYSNNGGRTMDLFVYAADATRTPPRLSRLPPCPLENPVRRNTGIVRCSAGDEEEYAVVLFRLKIFDGHCRAAEVASYRSAAGHWETKELLFPHDSNDVLDPLDRQEDAVIPFPEKRCICWVDYKTGILFFNVFDEMPALTFHPFPVAVPEERRRRGRRHCLQDNRRTVCVSQGKMRFVDVNNGGDPRRTSGFTISKWTLSMSGGMPQSWEEDCDVLQVDQLWALEEYRGRELPLWVPEFPVVSKQDHHIVHFVVQDPETFMHTWLITIDMRTQKRMKVAETSFSTQLSLLLSSPNTTRCRQACWRREESIFTGLLECLMRSCSWLLDIWRDGSVFALEVWRYWKFLLPIACDFSYRELIYAVC